LVTNSASDFAGVQGYKGWSYMWEGDGARNSFNWRTLPQWDGSCWRTGTWEKDVRICRTELHPGWSTDISRQWRSTVSGDVRIDLTARKLDTGGGDGVEIVVCKLANCFRRYTVGAQDRVGFADSLILPVAQGDLFYFVVKVRGDSTYDTAAMEISIFQRST